MSGQGERGATGVVEPRADATAARRAGMRKAPLRAANALVSAAVVALFLVHAVGNSFQMIGVGTPLSKALSWVLVALCVVHAGIGVALTAQTLRAQRAAGVAYPGLNARFWAVRVSGLAIALLILFHAVTFLRPATGPVRLNYFGTLQLAGNVLLVVAMAVHVLLSVQPMLVSLGVPRPRARAVDVAIAACVLLVIMAVAFVVYWLRWSVV